MTALYNCFNGREPASSPLVFHFEGGSANAYNLGCSAPREMGSGGRKGGATMPAKSKIRSPLLGAIVPGITMEIRWCPAHKGIAGNEKADEWAKITAEEPDTHGMEWLNYSDRTEVRAMPLPRSLANLKREISEKK